MNFGVEKTRVFPIPADEVGRGWEGGGGEEGELGQKILYYLFYILYFNFIFYKSKIQYLYLKFYQRIL